MADRAISALPTATTLTASDLFVLSQGNQAKNTTWSVIIGYLTTALDGHGGIQSIVKTGASGLVDTYTVTLADETTYSFTVTNGKAVASITQYWAVSASNSVAPSTWYDTLQTMTAVDRYLWSKVKYTFNDASTLETTASVIGVYGDTGDAWYVHIKYASQEPTADADMGDVPDKWIGIYSGTSSTAPTSYTSYDWFQYKGDKGDTGDAAEILSQSVTYMEASSGTVIPSGSWTETIPPVTQGNFLWTRTILSFNDGSTVTSYSVARFGVDGTGSVASVNNVSPDGNGNVALAAANIPMSDNQSVQKHVADLGSEKADQIIISGVEESSTAANSYSVGQYLILSGVLYRVTVAITAGDTITDSGAGANVEAATVGGELTGLRNTLTQLEGSLEQEENSLFILNDHGDLALVDIPAGYYVYVKGHSIKPEGLYQNLSGAQIPQGTTLSNNITSVSSVFNTTVDKVNLLPMTNVNNSMNFTGWTDDIKRVKVDVMLSASGGIVNSIIINTDEFGVKTYGAFSLSYFQTTTAYCIFSFNITTAGITKVGETVSGWTGAHLEVRVTGYKTY